MPQLKLEPRQQHFAANRQPTPDVGEGWTMEEVTRLRQGTKTAGNRDRYWNSPLTGKKFRSRAEVGRFQNILAGLAGSIVEGDEDRAWKIFKQTSSTAKKQKPAVKSQQRKETLELEMPRQAASFDAAPRKRAADQLGEDIAREDIITTAGAKNSSAKSAADVDVTSRFRKKRKAQPPAVVNWRVQRIVRDLGRLDVLRRGDVGPDVVSDDEDETALDILVRKLVEDADEDGHVPPPADDDGDDEYFWGGGDDNDDDNIGGEMAVDHPFDNDGDVFMPAAPEHYRGEDADSIAVVTHSSADFQVPAAPATDLDTEPLVTDVNYNHGARNPLNDPTAQPVFQHGDDNELTPMRCLVHRQLEWFAATSKDVADRRGRTGRHIVLGQVGLRCVHCAHLPLSERTIAAVTYPRYYSGVSSSLTRYSLQHLMQCKQVPSHIKTFREKIRWRGKSKGKEYHEFLADGCQSIGIIEKDGRLFYDKSSTSAARVLDRGDVIGSDGSEEGYWLCDKCQLVKFANFEEACRHEEACHGTAAKHAFDGLGQSDHFLHNPDTLRRPDSTNQEEGAYLLSLCCECNELEDPSSDVPMLLCDGCDSATHLTCTKDVPKLTEVPEGEWFCSNCSLVNKFKEKRLSEDRAITAAFAAVGTVLEDNLFTTADKGTKRRPRRILGHLHGIFEGIPGVQSQFQPGRKGVRRCVVIGCTRNAGGPILRYMCRTHFKRALLLQKIQIMPNGERRFPCHLKDPSLPREHETAYVAVPPNAAHGMRVKCSNAACRSRGQNSLIYRENYRYCALCDIIIEKNQFNRSKHKHEDELAVEREKARSQVLHQAAAAAVSAEDDEIVYGFDSIRGHTKDRKRKGEYLFRVKWKNGEITSEPDTYLKEDDPASFIAYLKSSGLAKTKKYAWANAEEHV